MRAYARSVRIAPKKANVIAQMVRGMSAHEAMDLLSRTNKKAARLIEAVLKSALANATHNEKQRPEDLVVKTVVVNQAQSYRRGVPMARGRTRPMRKFLSHIEIILGVGTEEAPVKKNARNASQEAKKTVKRSSSAKSGTKKTSATSPTT